MKIREIASGLQFPEGPIAHGRRLGAAGRDRARHAQPRDARRPHPRRRRNSAAARTARPSAPTARSMSATTAASHGTTESRRLLPARRPGARLFRRAHRAGRPRHRPVRAPVRQRSTASALRGPNDIVFDAHGGFYFTDLGKVRAHRDGPRRRVLRPARRRAVHAIARPVMTPNGIGPLARRQHAVLRRDRRRAASGPSTSPRRARCARTPGPRRTAAACSAASPGGHFQRFDSMAVDAFGNI